MTRKRYSEDFKKQIVEIYNSGKTVIDIEREYDLHASVIYGWIKRFNKNGAFKELTIELLKKTDNSKCR